MLTAARPPYVVLLPLPALLATGAGPRRRALVAGAGALTLAQDWIVVGTAGLLSPARAGGDLLTGVQMGFISRHPLPLPTAIARTLRRQGDALGIR